MACEEASVFLIVSFPLRVCLQYANLPVRLPFPAPYFCPCLPDLTFLASSSVQKQRLRNQRSSAEPADGPAPPRPALRQ